MHSDALTKGLPGAKKWLKIDLKATAGKQGVDITQLQSLSGGGDPTQFLTYLAKAGDVRKVGSEDVNGTPTTHYHATIDFEKLAGSAGKAADSVRRLPSARLRTPGGAVATRAGERSPRPPRSAAPVGALQPAREVALEAGKPARGDAGAGQVDRVLEGLVAHEPILA